MIKNILISYLSISAIVAVIFLTGCTKEVPKELMDNKQQPMNNQQMPNDSIHMNLQKSDPHGSMGTTGADTSDTKVLVDKFIKEADDADAKYVKTKSEADKNLCIEKQLVAANFLTYEADLPPKQKYRPALKRYNRVLELDPSNKDALANKKQIEDIYESMGMPVPKD
ncbi:MAG: hypothetical protein EHM58_05265 [Ignavibacteriae bacterium]|nr:MAG: hypothetical protein EHM58_05265 [Ignavibacteriota bacterium]